MNTTPAPSTARRVLPRLAAAATVTVALVAGGAAATARPSSPDDVVALINAWPKKYTGGALVVEPPADTVTSG